MLTSAIKVSNNYLKLGLSALSFEPALGVFPYAMGLYAVNTLYYGAMMFSGTSKESTHNKKLAIKNFMNGLVLLGFVTFAPATIEMLALYVLVSYIVNGIKFKKGDFDSNTFLASIGHGVLASAFLMSFISPIFFTGSMVFLSINILCALYQLITATNNDKYYESLMHTIHDASHAVFLFTLVHFAPASIVAATLYLLSHELTHQIHSLIQDRGDVPTPSLVN